MVLPSLSALKQEIKAATGSRLKRRSYPKDSCLIFKRTDERYRCPQTPQVNSGVEPRQKLASMHAQWAEVLPEILQVTQSKSNGINFSTVHAGQWAVILKLLHLGLRCFFAFSLGLRHQLLQWCVGYKGWTEPHLPDPALNCIQRLEIHFPNSLKRVKSPASCT